MSTETEFETWVRSQLQEIADGVTPRPDPYGRLMRRRRLGWLRGGLLAGVAAVAVSGGVVAVAPAGTPEPKPTPSHHFSGELYWEASLVDAAPRGSVAADEAFTTDLAARIEELSRTGGGPLFNDPALRSLGEVDARVAFAEDIGDRRVVAVTLLRGFITSAIQRYGAARLLWLAGPRGASAAALLESSDGVDFLMAGVDPFVIATFGAPGEYPIIGTSAGAPPNAALVRIGLAPPGCEVSTAPSEDLDAWKAEPTGSYIVRTAAHDRPEFVRVTCDGVIREEWPMDRPRITSDDITAILGAAVGDPERAHVTAAAEALVESFGAELVAPPRLVWAGRVPHDKDFDSFSTSYTGTNFAADPYNPQVTLLAAPAARGGWIGYLSIEIGAQPAVPVPVGTPTFSTPTEPGAPGIVLALKLVGWSPLVFVLAPEGATRVRLVAPDGAVLDESVVTQRGMLLALPSPAPSGVRAETVDAAGAVIATGELGTTSGLGRHQLRDWS